MKTVRSCNAAGISEQGCVVTIGNFDGVHNGHQHMLSKARMRAKSLDLPLVVLTFDPLPSEFFALDLAPARLSHLTDRACALSFYDVDVLVVLRFNAALANTSAEDFIEQHLRQGLNVKSVIVGDDFKFGKDRKGDAQMLRNVGTENGFSVFQMESQRIAGVRVSSTLIRKALAEGNLAQAKEWLGRRYSLSGRVMHGDKRGRSIGFPTLNLKVTRPNPLNGVYAVSVRGLCFEKIYGVANIGVRPTVDGDSRKLEVHCFDYAGDAYGKRITVKFHHKLRDEQKFDGIDALKNQINLDQQTARDYFSVQNND